MAEAIVYRLAQEILKNLGSTAINEIAAAWGFKKELKKLNNIINSLKDVLLDAQERQADTPAIRTWLERLTYVVCAADDLFDEFATVVARKDLLGGNKLSKEVTTFFSSSNQIAVAFKISQKIKSIRKKLDDIAEDGNMFSFVRRPHEGGRVISSRNRDQTYSFVNAEKVIGRDDDRKAVLDLLLSSSCVDEHEVLPVIAIVGMGGMGKTTLAQLIYNEARVEEEFGLRLWVCVSDVFDIKAIVEKLLMSATGDGAGNLEMEQLQHKWRQIIRNEKYFLVLDDLWNERSEEWLKLKELLNCGSKGSKILVTTRSRKVAKIMGTSPPHELSGLSEGDSWDLFEMMAFGRGEAEQKPNLVKIGKQIVRKCGRVPLVIRALASVLYGEEESRWLSVKDKSIAKIPEDQCDVLNVLKVSYDHLRSPLKNCFAYCAMFPKDYVFRKELLIQLWMAEGFIDQASNEGQSLEDVGEEYFLILLQRCFFQDVKRDEWGDIKLCKMHDLMHDLAEEMAGVMCKVASLGERISDDKILHLSLDDYARGFSRQVADSIRNLKLLRTFLLLKPKYAFVNTVSMGLQLLKRLSSLRVLDMRCFDLEILPDTIGKLIHLRYLDFSWTALKKLPESITDLLNLQTLRLQGCQNLTRLPTSMRKLTNLTTLDIDLLDCDNLAHMPSGIEGLTSLIKLPLFIAGHRRSTSRLRLKPTSTAKLSDLRNLNNLRGELKILIHRNTKNNLLEATKADLSCKNRLTKLEIEFSRGDDEDFDCEHDEVVLEGLKPHFNIKDLYINMYRGKKLPSWARLNNLCINLPNLVRIALCNCQTSEELPVFSQLCFLKYLRIGWMGSVEYMEDRDNEVVSSTSRSEVIGSLFFPSLVELQLMCMGNLKGWWKEGEATECNKEIEGASHESARQFSKLSKLRIEECPNLRRLPHCPNIEDLTLCNTNESLSVPRMVTTLSSSPDMSSSSENGGKLKRLRIDNAEDLTLVPNHCLHQLSYLAVNEDRKLESTAKLGEILTALSSSLRHLQFYYCDRLRSIAKGLEHLSALETLVFVGCDELDITGFEDEDEDCGMPWKALSTILRSVTLADLPKLAGLPRGFQHLRNLQDLRLTNNAQLEEVPEWISCLTSLRVLELDECPKLKSLPDAFRNMTTLNTIRISGCPGLKEGCRAPNGSDWLKIQHIRNVDLRRIDKVG